MSFYTDDFSSYDSPFAQNIWNDLTIQKLVNNAEPKSVPLYIKFNYIRNYGNNIEITNVKIYLYIYNDETEESVKKMIFKTDKIDDVNLEYFCYILSQKNEKCFFVFDSVDPQRYKKTLSDFLGVKLLHFITTQKLLQNIDTIIKPVLENIMQNRKNTRKLKEEDDE